jgi:Cu/Ag efflux protein CusF
MRLSRILLAVSLSTGLVFAGTTTATTDKAPATEKAPAKAALVKITGKIEAVDAIGNILVVKGAKKVDSIAITSDTKITNAGKDVALADVKTGENVKVMAKKDDGKLTATDVKIGVAPSKKAAAATTPAATPAATTPAPATTK